MLMSISGSLGSVLLVRGSLGELTHFTAAGTGVWDQSQGSFSPLASGTLVQALWGAGYLFFGSLCGAQGEK